MHSAYWHRPITRPMESLWVAVELLAVVVKVVWAVIFATLRAVWPKHLSSVSHKIVLITGAGKGIGRELAVQYGRLGATVVCVDVNQGLNEATVGDLKKQGIKAHAYTCNVGRKEEVMDLAKRVEKEIGMINILVNNAGVLVCKTLLDHSESDVLQTFNVNIISQFWTMQAFLPAMVTAKAGHVVALSSVGGLEATANASAYCATKFAVRGLMEAAREESRKNNWNIKFTTLCPFFVDTGMCKEPQIRFTSALGMLTTEEVAAAVVAAQRGGFTEMSIPTFLRSAIHLRKILPDAANVAIQEFVATGITPSKC